MTLGSPLVRVSSAAGCHGPVDRSPRL